MNFIFKNLRQNLINFFFISLITIIIFIIAETSSYYILKSKGYKSYNEINNPQKWDVYTLFWGKRNWQSGKIKFNSLGYWDDEITEKKKYRIVILGGSTAWGSGVNDNNHTIASQMEKYFVQKGLDIEVINAGMGGFNSLQELQLFIYQIVYMDPDLVLTIDGNNDIAQVSNTNLFKSNYYANILQRKIDNISFTAAKKTDYGLFLKNFIGNLNIIQLSNIYFSKFRTNNEKILNLKDYDISIIRYTNNLKILASILKGLNIQGLFLLQPHAVFIDPININQIKLMFAPDDLFKIKKNDSNLPMHITEKFYEKDKFEKMKRDDLINLTKKILNQKDFDMYLLDILNNYQISGKKIIYEYFYDRAYNKLSQENFLLGFKLIDTRKYFRNQENIWFDEVHLNEKGQSIFAQYIVDQIIKNIDIDEMSTTVFSEVFFN